LDHAYCITEGRGYVKVHDNEDFEILHPPFKMDSVLMEGEHYEGYTLAVYHQLHCLVAALPLSNLLQIFDRIY
jgi:hypothetical protein